MATGGLIYEKNIVCNIGVCTAVSYTHLDVYKRQHKGVNVPGVELNMPFVSPKDLADIVFAVEQDYDFIAASFTRTAEDIICLLYTSGVYTGGKPYCRQGRHHQICDRQCSEKI